jgi:hypothetical protein
MSFDTLSSQESFAATKLALEQNGFMVMIVENGEEAKKIVFEKIPIQAEIMTMSSVTLDTLGISKEINESGKYDSVKKKLSAMNRETQGSEMQKLGAAPAWAIGSVHAVTEDGHVLVASRSGSQIPGYSYGAQHVIWVVGGQKIVKNTDEGMRRIYEYCLPLESVRVQKAYGMESSSVNRILIMNKEDNKERSLIILVKEVLGY